MIREIKRVTYAKSTLPESWIIPNGDAARKIPILFSVFVIRTDDRTVLVDAGCDTMPGFEMEDFIGPVAALEREGICAQEITDVILTHAHHDHAQCVCHFPAASIHLQREELPSFQKQGFLKSDTRLCLFDDRLELEDGLCAVHVGGHAVGSCVVEVRLNGRDFVLCGDECYSMRNITERIPTASSVSKERSQAFIDRYANGNYVCLLAHDQ